MTDEHAAHDPAHPDSDHGHDDHDAGAHGGDGHGGEVLGPVDVTMWGVGLVGVALGLLVTVCVAFATGVF